MTITGLAFSGGGIRSAAFCSGVLRRLLECEVEVDYLSCVSGGGYTGTAYLDWKYREERKVKMEGKEGEAQKDWHAEFFDHMTQRSGYICNWMEPWNGILDTIVFIWVILLVTIIQPLIKWGAYACPVAFIIDYCFGRLMVESADCDAALAIERQKNSSAGPDKALIERCLSGSDDKYIFVLFVVLFVLFIACYIISRSSLRILLRLNHGLRILLRFSQYIFGSFFLLTFIPFAIYDFMEKIPFWAQALVGIIAVIVWIVLPLLRSKTSYVLIVYSYSYVIYWKVYIAQRDIDKIHLFHKLLFVSGLFFWITPFVTTLQEKLVHTYNKWRLQKAFYHKESIGPAGCSGIGLRHICHLWACVSRGEDKSDGVTRPLTLADLKGMKPEYLSNMVVNRWKKSNKCKDSYELLTMSPTGIERLDREPREKQFKGKLEPKDIMLSDAMATSAAALSTHMGKYDRSIDGLTRLKTIVGLEMGAIMISDVQSLKKESVLTKVVVYLINIVPGLPLFAVPTLYHYDQLPDRLTDSSVKTALVAFIIIHLVLALIAITDTGAEKPRWREKLARWFIVHNCFVYFVREIFSKNNIGPTPPAVLLLSDGGHFENLAILPLLKRKLKRIVVVDGGYKHEDEDYEKSILYAMMLARTELNCAFVSEDGHDVTSDLLQKFVKPQLGGNPRYYKFKVHYQSDEVGGNDEGEILLIVPRNPQPGVIDEIDNNGSVTIDLHLLDEPDGLHYGMALEDEDVRELTLCCCECCHRKSCHWLSKIFCNVFPQHHTVNQFFTPRMFSAYHREGYRACVEAKADGFLKDLFSKRRQMEDGSEDPNVSLFQPLSSSSRIGEFVI